MPMIKQPIRFFTTIFCLLLLNMLLNGCAATHTAINKRNLDVQTKMSASIFLDPVTSDKRTIFVQVRNTTDKQDLDLERCVVANLEAKGYTIAHAPEAAHYLLQANVLQVGRNDLRAAEYALNQGFGAALTGAAIGASVASLGNKDNTGRVVAGGVLGAAVATVSDAMVQDVVYCVITDLQVSERVGNAVKVREKTKSKLIQGTTGVKEITSIEEVAWKRYQTRVVSTANKVNLKFDQAMPELVRGLTRSIAGVF